jgi:hypothetical protein
MPIQLRDKSSCQYDLIALGEIMLRLDPGESRYELAFNCAMRACKDALASPKSIRVLSL